jgi:ferredoxin
MADEVKGATIYYFSGTGNTFRAASIIRKKLEDSGYLVSLRNVEKGLYASTTGLDIFAFPVYAYDVPEIMMRYIHSMAPAQNKKAAVIAVHGMLWQKPVVPGDGGDPGYSFEHARWALSRKGYDVAYTIAVGYPHSITTLLSAPRPEEIVKIREASDKRVEAFADMVANDKKSLQKCGPLPVIYSLLPGLMFRIFGRRGFGKFYVADTACIKCGRCIDSCPAKAIRFSLGRPRWGWKCQGCQRCINICPQKAVQASLPRAFVMFAGLFIPWNTLAFNLLHITPPAGITGTVIDIAAWASLYLIFLFLADKLLFGMEAIPIVGKVMSLNLSSPNRRYMDPVFKSAMNEETAEKVEATMY